MKEETDRDSQKIRVWLKEEGKPAVVRRIEAHPTYGKQYLVTAYSASWGPETYWVKESNVGQMGGQGRSSASGGG